MTLPAAGEKNPQKGAVIGKRSRRNHTPAKASKTGQPDIKEPHAKIGQLALEVGFLKHVLGRVDGPSAKR
jgi:hypothetical protein